MADTTKPPPRPFGPALFADWSNVKIDSPSSAPRDSVRYMTWELGVLLEAEPHYRAKGRDATADTMKRAIEDLDGGSYFAIRQALDFARISPRNGPRL